MLRNIFFFFLILVYFLGSISCFYNLDIINDSSKPDSVKITYLWEKVEGETIEKPDENMMKFIEEAENRQNGKVAEEKLTPLESWDRYEEFEENLKKYKLIARKQMKEANWPKNRWSNEYMRLHKLEKPKIIYYTPDEFIKEMMKLGYSTEEPVKPKKGSDILEEMIKPVEKPVKSCITEPEYDYDIEKLEEMFRNQETDDWSFDD